MKTSAAATLLLSDCDCAADSANRLLELLLDVEGVVGCFIADEQGGVGFERLPGLLRQTQFFHRAQCALRSFIGFLPTLETSSLRVEVLGGDLFVRRVESLYLCAMTRRGSNVRPVSRAMRLVTANMPGGLKLAPSLPPPARYN